MEKALFCELNTRHFEKIIYVFYTIALMVRKRLGATGHAPFPLTRR